MAATVPDAGTAVVQAEKGEAQESAFAILMKFPLCDGRELFREAIPLRGLQRIPNLTAHSVREPLGVDMAVIVGAYHCRHNDNAPVTCNGTATNGICVDGQGDE